MMQPPIPNYHIRNDSYTDILKLLVWTKGKPRQGRWRVVKKEREFFAYKNGNGKYTKK